MDATSFRHCARAYYFASLWPNGRWLSRLHRCASGFTPLTRAPSAEKCVAAMRGGFQAAVNAIHGPGKRAFRRYDPLMPWGRLSQERRARTVGDGAPRATGPGQALPFIAPARHRMLPSRLRIATNSGRKEAGITGKCTKRRKGRHCRRPLLSLRRHAVYARQPRDTGVLSPPAMRRDMWVY